MRVSEKIITEYRKEPMDSVREVLKMLEADPENPELQDWLAFVYYTNEMWDAAVDIYKKLIKQGFRVASQRLYLGNALYKKGLHSAAISEWLRVAELDPTGPLGRKARKRLDEARESRG